MTYDAFVGRVQSLANLPSSGDAHRAIRSTLETLTERLGEDAAENLASELPSEIGHHLRVDVPFNRLSIEQFFDRVQERECEGSVFVDRPEAVYHARVVLDVLREALSAGSYEKLAAQLPAEYQPLLAAGSQGEMRGGR